VGMTIPQAQNVLSEAAKSVERAVAVGSAVDSEIEGAQTNLPKAEQAFEEAIRSIGSVLGAGIELTGLKQAADGYGAVAGRYGHGGRRQSDRPGPRDR
jgi:hypothetical protein